MNSQAYKDRTLNRDKLRVLVAGKHGGPAPRRDPLSAPEDPGRAVPGADQPERNGTLSNGTGFPAVTFPGGFSSPTATAPLGVPVGAELLGLGLFRSAGCCRYAYAYEQAFKPRKPPLSTPPLR